MTKKFKLKKINPNAFQSLLKLNTFDLSLVVFFPTIVNYHPLELILPDHMLGNFKLLTDFSVNINSNWSDSLN